MKYSLYEGAHNNKTLFVFVKTFLCIVPLMYLCSDILYPYILLSIAKLQERPTEQGKASKQRARLCTMKLIQINEPRRVNFFWDPWEQI